MVPKEKEKEKDLGLYGHLNLGMANSEPTERIGASMK
jgi:hypothetical protein